VIQGLSVFGIIYPDYLIFFDIDENATLSLVHDGMQTKSKRR
jgi:hypothetical protein